MLFYTMCHFWAENAMKCQHFTLVQNPTRKPANQVHKCGPYMSACVSRSFTDFARNVQRWLFEGARSETDNCEGGEPITMRTENVVC